MPTVQHGTEPPPRTTDPSSPTGGVHMTPEEALALAEAENAAYRSAKRMVHEPTSAAQVAGPRAQEQTLRR